MKLRGSNPSALPRRLHERPIDPERYAYVLARPTSTLVRLERWSVPAVLDLSTRDDRDAARDDVPLGEWARR